MHQVQVFNLQFHLLGLHQPLSLAGNNPSTSNTSFFDKGIRTDKMPQVTGAQFTLQTENKLGLKIHTHQIKKAIKNITKIKTEKTNLPI